MLSVRALTYTLPDGHVLFHNLNFTLDKKKYGLVGINGVGKSTLGRILSGELEIGQGQISGTVRATYLAQWEVPSKVTVGEFLVDIWENVEPTVREALLADIDLTKDLTTLSGGQWMRVRLLSAVAKAGDILILDEPTNNLDRDSRQSLYYFVANFRGALLVISHDRELLEIVEEIWELSNQGLAIYGGNFGFYDQLRQVERDLLSYRIDVARREKKKQEREHIKKVARQLRRTRIAEKKAPDMGLSKITLGRRKRQAQVSLGKIHVAEIERDNQRHLEFLKLYEQKKQRSELRVDFSVEGKSKGKVIFSLDQFNCRYKGAKEWLWQQPLTFTFYAGERLVLRGANGSGKSTLLKILTGELTFEDCECAGRVSEISRNFVYLDQHYSGLNDKQNIMENILEDCRFDPTEARSRLADFGFTRESVFKPVRVLSGGERLRLSLAKLAFALKPPQLWILDEPTNNLDLESLALLEASLNEYDGSLVVVSHDEYFVESINCTQQIELEPAQSGDRD